MQLHHKLGYRPDIDGLRAVAVLSVIAFHMSSRTLPGGYLGVDIFFCLSGYLITSIIWREALDDRFSLKSFYERRIRRIAPALLFLIAIISPLATLLLLPADLIGYGKSLIASLLFVANIYFWRDTNYFAQIAEQKPLLHLWSLGVEEQFYIFFPLLLIALKRWFPRGVVAIVAALTILSLALDAFAIQSGGAGPAFFLLPTRIWELGVGALLALAPKRARFKGSANLIAGLGGALLILFGLLLKTDLVVGVLPAAFPVVAGTALALTAGSGSVVNRFLSTAPFRNIGLISYSLYLWHWPILVFSRYYLVRELSLAELSMSFSLMLILAYLSWRYVERPFRRQISARKVYRFTGAGASAAALFGFALIFSSGLPSRLRPEVAIINAAVGTNYRCAVNEYRVFGASRACVLNLPDGDLASARVVLLGNSFSQMYAPIVRDLLREFGQPGILVPANGCLPTPALNLSTECASIARTNMAAIGSLHHLRLVVLGLTYHDPSLIASDGTTPKDRLGALISALDALIAQLQARGIRVALIGPIAIPGYDIASEVSRRRAFGWPVHTPLNEPQAQFMDTYGKVISHFSDRKDIIFIRPDKVQCNERNCTFIRNGRSLFADAGHIAQAELPLFAPEFKKTLAGELSKLSIN